MKASERRILLYLLVFIIATFVVVGLFAFQRSLDMTGESAYQTEKALIESRNATIDAKFRSP